MSIPNETSIVCNKCGVFNISTAIILNGKTYCLRCFAKNSDAREGLLKMLWEEDHLY